MINILSKILKDTFIFFIAVSLTSCAIKTRYSEGVKINLENKEGTMVTLKPRKFNYRYDLKEVDENLFFQITVENITDTSLNIPRDTTPYSLTYKGDPVANNFSSFSTTSPRKDILITIKPGERYKYNFFINSDYNLLEGKNLYELRYVSDTFEHDPWKLPDQTYFKKIKFIWVKNDHNEGGRLVKIYHED